MATWQADFEVLPPDDWSATRFCADIEKTLPRGRAWTAELITFGDEDGHRVDVWGDEREIMLRVDMRKPNRALFDAILKVLRQHACVLRSELGHSLPPESEPFLEALRVSPAYRFVQDPAAFLEHVRLQGVDDRTRK